MCALINLFLFFVTVTICFGKPSQMKIDIKPKADTKNVGEQLNVLCTVPNTTLSDCLFDIGGDTHKPLLEGDGDIVYYGSGLENGQCGATIKNVALNYHGKIICKVLVSGESSFRTAEMDLIIRKMPKDPVLTLEPHSGPFVEGDRITASCKLNGGRPAPEVSLSLENDSSNGGQKLTHPENSNDVVVTNDWVLSSEDDRKSITCLAHHDAWEGKVRYASSVISVQYKPIIHDNVGVLTKEDIVYSGLVLGENASVIVKVKANPKPTLVRWAAGNEAIGDDDERIRKEEIDEENGIYIYKLSIPNLTKSDVLNTYLFEVTNTIGNASVDIRMQAKKQQEEPLVPQSQARPGGSALALACAGAALLAVAGGVLLAKMKNMCCFASKTPPVHTGHLIVDE